MTPITVRGPLWSVIFSPTMFGSAPKSSCQVWCANSTASVPSRSSSAMNTRPMSGWTPRAVNTLALTRRLLTRRGSPRPVSVASKSINAPR